MSKQIKKFVDRFNKAASTYDYNEVSLIAEECMKHIKSNIASQPVSFTKTLAEAVRTFDHREVEKLCNKLVDHLRTRARPYPLNESKKILGILRRKRYFMLMSTVADVFIQAGQDAPEIRRQYAQALLDQGNISASLDVLHILKKQCEEQNNAKELAETIGLIGRAQKQIYMDAAAAGKRPGAVLRKNLEQAASAYSGVYVKAKENIWHGVNTIALLDRAKRDKVAVAKDLPDTKKTATAIIKHVEAKKEADLWDYASAAEASLGLKDYKQALDWVVKYTRDSPYADAFEYASTLRQFEEVWKLDDNNKQQAQILHLLRAALLQQEGGRIEIHDPSHSANIAAALESDKQFEKILGKDRYKTITWYLNGLERAKGVAQIIDRSGNGLGSGFLVRAADLHQSIAQDWVLITNAHVISNDPNELTTTRPSLPPDEVTIRFEAKDPNKEYMVDQVLFTSPRTELDFTIVSLQTPVQLEKPYPIAKRLPVLNKNQRVYVIGHPKGGGLSFSLNDNLLLDHEKPKVHYRAPTEEGSSGSPVFNQQWDLLALHHAGGKNINRLNNQPGTYPANEGLYIQSIRDAIAASLR